MMRRLLVGGLVGVVVLAALSGCDDAFDPFVDRAEGYAIYGFLDARADVQRVRLQPIADRAPEPTLEGVSVTSTPIGGAPLAWDGSLVALDDGSSGLLFTAAFRPEPGVTYRLDVAGGGGSAQAVDVPVPAEPVVTPLDPVQIGTIISQRVRIETEIRPTAAQVIYRARPVGGTARDVFIGLEAAPALGAPGFEVLVGLGRNVAQVRSEVGAEFGEEVELLGLRLRYDLVDPTRTSIDDGLGFVGVAASFEARWVLPPETVEALNYIDRQGEER